MAYNFLFANNATTTLAQAISATATVITVASGDGALFPSPNIGQAFAITLVDATTGLTNEICYCTSRSGDELTVIRGQEGKNATSWSAGDTCANYITAGVFATWLNEGVADSRYLMLNNSTTQTVGGPVTFGSLVLVPEVNNNFSTQQAAAAISVKNNFVKQGWSFSNFGTNQIYLGWRTDASGLGLGIDNADVGTIALKSNVMPSQAVFGQASQVYYTPTPSSSQTTTHIVDLTFTAVYDGLVYASASFNVSNIQPSQCQGLIQIEGSSYQPSSGPTLWSDTTLFPMSGSGLMRVKKGDNITVVASYNIPPSSSSFASVGQTITYTFTPSGY